MQPRLKTSRKWTPLPAELTTQIRSIFAENFATQTKDGRIEVRGRIYPQEILIAVGYRAPKTLRQQNWEISIAYAQNKDNVMKLLHVGVDAVGALFEQLFAAENDYEFPRVWEAVEFEGRQIFIQFTTENSELEAEANRLLGVNDDGGADVAQGDWDDDVSPDVIKATLGIDPGLGADAEAAESEDPPPDGRETH